MPRGRRAKPDEIKAIQGNPGKRRLTIPRAPRRGSLPSAEEVRPDFVKLERERELFRRVVDEYLQRRIARPSDAMAFGRYAVYLARWWEFKEALDGKVTFYKSKSPHGEYFRDHPIWRHLMQTEKALQSLEDRLGLNIVSRQNIARGMVSIPPALGGLFGEDPGEKPDGDAPPNAPTIAEMDDSMPPSPIGLGKLN